MPILNRYYIQGEKRHPSPFHLQRAGARLDVEIQVPPEIAEELQKKDLPLPMPITGKALIDTGASITGVDRDEIVRQLKIPPVGVTKVLTPSGEANQNIYPVSLSFPGTELPIFPLVFAVGSELKNQNFVALIGRDILSRCVFIFNGKGATITLSI